jgi:hypothetical protein
VSESTKCTPFFAVQGANTQTSFAGEPTQDRDQHSLEAYQVQASKQQIHEHLRVQMRRIQVIQEEGANQERIPAPNI